jgi:hypothetical protein
MKLAERKNDVRRAVILVQQQALAQEVEASRQRLSRHEQSQFRDESARIRQEDRMRTLDAQRAELGKVGEAARLALAKIRADRQKLLDLGENATASLHVRRVAYDGVTLQVANAEPVMLKEPRMNLKIDIS